MLVYELDCARNCWQLVSETKVSFYEHIEVTYFDSDLVPRQAASELGFVVRKCLTCDDSCTTLLLMRGAVPSSRKGEDHEKEWSGGE